jgi:hypothetical protein
MEKITTSDDPSKTIPVRETQEKFLMLIKTIWGFVDVLITTSKSDE